jgi:hypothetical protein
LISGCTEPGQLERDEAACALSGLFLFQEKITTKDTKVHEETARGLFLQVDVLDFLDGMAEEHGSEAAEFSD